MIPGVVMQGWSVFSRCSFQFLIMGLLAAPAVGLAQGQPPVVVGWVADDRGDPLQHATIVVLESGRSAMTDEEGRFTLRSHPAGPHQLHVSLIGFAPLTRKVTIPAAGQSVRVELRLARTPLTLPGLQVTATPMASNPQAVLQATMQLGGRALERELSTTLAETLRNQPGLAVRYNGPAAAAPVIRGLTGDRILVLQDGQRAADLSGSADDHGVTIDPLVAQRIEVVRGPATLLYGNNALGGVVNVISDDLPTSLPPRPSMLSGIQVESAYPGISGSFKTTLPLGGDWAATLRGGAKETGDMRIGVGSPLGDRLPNTQARNINGAIGVGYLGRRMTTVGSFKLYHFAYGLPVPPDADPVKLHGRRQEAAGRLDLTLTSKVFPLLRMEGTAQDYRHDEVAADSEELLQAFALRTRTMRAMLRQGTVGPFTEGAWGISGLFKDYAATGPAALTPAAGSHSLGLFGFQELAFATEGIALQFGGRYDLYRIVSRASDNFGPGRAATYRALSGSVGLRAPLGGGVSVSTSFARSFRAPTVEELFSGAYHAGTGTIEVGDPGLRAERGHAVEGVLRIQTTRWNGQIAVYHNAISDFIYMASQGDTIIDGTATQILAYKQDRAALTGLEGNLEWALNANVAIGVTGDIVRGELRGGTPLSFMPPARLGGEIRWDDGTFSIGASMRHELSQTRVGFAGERPTDAHTSLRLSTGLRKTVAGVTHSISIRGDNLANSLHREATSRIKDFAPNPGRNISFIYRIHF